ncbi:hypothetical protein [Yersinia intermedia]|jgi:hypothetical protein|nr:hypothetical protein [Yersinia intermedia]
MDDNENRSYHRPLWDDNGRFYYELIPQAKEKITWRFASCRLKR